MSGRITWPSTSGNVKLPQVMALWHPDRRRSTRDIDAASESQSESIFHLFNVNDH